VGKYDALVELLLEVVKEGGDIKQQDYSIPVGISNRHIHLSRNDVNALFGEGYPLTKTKDLSQPGQYACQETLTICGPKGAIENVRILGPERQKSQVEILKTDCFKLGLKAPVKLSGELRGTPGITLVGPKGSILLGQGVIIAQRHIHMSPEDAQRFGVRDGELVTIQISGLRGGMYSNVAIRANTASQLECHIDTDEANAMELAPTSKITLVK